MISLRTALAFSVATLLIVANANGQDAKLFFGEIPIQYVGPGEKVVLDLHRFLHPLEASVRVDGAEGASFDAKAFTLTVKANAAGLSRSQIIAEWKGQKITRLLVLAVEPAPSTRITFKPLRPAQKVMIAGKFNNWNSGATPMKGPDAAGLYQIDLPLSPGRQAYKFIVDGEWTLDPANSVVEDNGQGGKNSVVNVEKKSRETPTIYADQRAANKVTIRAVSPDQPIANVLVITQTKSGDSVGEAKVEGGKIEVPATSKADSIRIIAATELGAPTNTVYCSSRELAPPKKKQFDWHDAILYYALTDRFADGDKSNDKPVDDPHVAPPANFHGGDLRGIRNKIEDGYFESLGINTLWIAPLNKNPDHAYQESPEPHRWYTGYHGYWPISPTEVDPHSGSGKDLQALIDSAHKHDIKVIADLVLHHVHEEHPWWKEHRDWFGTLELPDGRKNLRLWDEKQFTTWFEPYLPSFDFSKDEPVKALIDNTVWWATHYQLDGFRVDAVKHIVPSFWWKFRAGLRERIEEKRGVPLYLVGETFKDRAGIMSFVGPNMLDGQFDFPLYDSIKDSLGVGSADLQSLDDAMRASERSYGSPALMSPLIGNHDKGRFMAYADGELPDPAFAKEEEVGWQKPPKIRDPVNYAKLELAQALLMSTDGVPMVYYGDEIGMTGAGDPDNRRDMRFGEQLTADEKTVLEHFGKLTALRRAYDTLRYGSRRTLLRENDCLAFVRAYFDDRVLVILNRSKSSCDLSLDPSPELPPDTLVDLITNEQMKSIAGKLSVTVPAMSAAFISAAVNR